MALPLIYLVSSCEDNDLETRGIDPFFRIQFINQSRINALDIRIANIDTRIGIIDDSLGLLDTLNIGIDFTADIERLNTEKTNLNAQKSDFNSTKGIIASGSLVVNSITSPSGIDPKLPGIDSANLFSIPLNPAEDVSDYDISIAGTVYDLQASYTRNTIIDQRTVIVEALDLSLSSNSLEIVLPIEYQDSLSNKSNDAIVTVLF